MAALAELGIAVKIWPMPSKCRLPIRFTEDRVHKSYDAAAASIWWRAMAPQRRCHERVPRDFVGKSSPVHFWWGGFDLAVTRFNGHARRSVRAPTR